MSWQELAILMETENKKGMTTFLKNTGLNRRLQNRRVAIGWGEPYDLVATGPKNFDFSRVVEMPGIEPGSSAGRGYGPHVSPFWDTSGGRKVAKTA